MVSTVNIQHLESLGDVVESITGVRQRETVPDEVVRRADQIELVDMSPQALRRRMAHGNIYKPDKVDAALSNYFRPGNLTALRELALLWIADRVDEYLQQYRGEHRISPTWQARERIVVGLTGGPEGRTLIRRAARIAAKGSGSEILGRLHRAQRRAHRPPRPRNWRVQRTLVEDLGGTFHHVVGDDMPAALLDFARGVNATQIVLGSSRRKAWQYVFGPGRRRDRRPRVRARPRRPHRHPRARPPRAAGCPWRAAPGSGRSRIVWGWLVGVVGPVLLTLLLSHRPPARPGQRHAAVPRPDGGRGAARRPAARAGLGGRRLAAAELLLHPARCTPSTIAEPKNIVAIVIFVAVAVAVASVVDLAARRTHQAARLRAESEILSYLAGSVLRGETTLDALLERVRETFGMESVALLERGERRRPVDLRRQRRPRPVSNGPRTPTWTCRSATAWRWRSPAGCCPPRTAGCWPRSPPRPPSSWTGGGCSERGRPGRGSWPRATGSARRCWPPSATTCAPRWPASRPRSASLRSDDVAWSEEDEAELLEGIEDGADRLDHLVGNLLDMSRLQTGTVTPMIREIDLDEVVPMALGGVPEESVDLDIPETLPMVAVDAGPAGARRRQPGRERRQVQPGRRARRWSRRAPSADRVEVRVVDRGPGVPDEAKERIFEPFQRYGDAPRGAGVGLGLAVARGFAEAMGGTLDAEDTPGGGLTMVLTLRGRHGRPHAGPAAELPADGSEHMTRQTRKAGLMLQPGRGDTPGPREGARGRRRAADRPRPGDQPEGPQVRGRRGARRRHRAASSPPPATPTSSSSTSGCPTWTASR